MSQTTDQKTQVKSPTLSAAQIVSDPEIKMILEQMTSSPDPIVQHCLKRVRAGMAHGQQLGTKLQSLNQERQQLEEEAVRTAGAVEAYLRDLYEAVKSKHPVEGTKP
jgi:hypothetical protein